MVAMVRFVAPRIERLARPGGGFILRSTAPVPAHLRCLGDALVRWASEAPERTLYAERDEAGAWRHVSYRAALGAARALGQALLDLGLGPARPLMVLSGNSIDHALLALAAMHVGVPIAPISPAYSLASRDHGKLRLLAELLRPGAIYVASRAAFAPALVMIAYAVAFSALPFRLRAEPFDLDAHAVGLVYGIWLIGLLAPMTGRLAHRLGPARLLPLLVVLAAVGVGLTLPDRLPLIVVGLTLLALSLFGAITAAQLLVPRLVPEATGAAMGVYVSVYYLGGSGGGVLAGLAWQHGGWPTVVAVCATALAGAAVAALALRRRLARA